MKLVSVVVAVLLELLTWSRCFCVVLMLLYYLQWETMVNRNLHILGAKTPRDGVFFPSEFFQMLCLSFPHIHHLMLSIMIRFISFSF